MSGRAPPYGAEPRKIGLPDVGNACTSMMSTPVPDGAAVLRAHPPIVSVEPAVTLAPLAGKSSHIVVGPGTVNVGQLPPHVVPPAFAMMVAVPGASGDALPLWSMRTTDGALLLHRKPSTNVSTVLVVLLQQKN